MRTAKANKTEMRKEYDSSKGSRGKYAGRIQPGDTDLRNCKVRVNMYLDADIVEYFKRRAAKRNAAPYQTQINSALRELMEGSEEHDYLRLVEDEGFINAVAARVKARGVRSK